MQNHPLSPVRWTFYGRGPYPGFSDGSRWLAFANVWITPDARDAIASCWRSSALTSELFYAAALAALRPEPSGLVSLAHSWPCEVPQPEPPPRLLAGLKPLLWSIAGHGPFEGLTDGSMWRGHPNVWISFAARDDIVAHLTREALPRPESLLLARALAHLTADGAGLVSLADGWPVTAKVPPRRPNGPDRC